MFNILHTDISEETRDLQHLMPAVSTTEIEIFSSCTNSSAERTQTRSKDKDLQLQLQCQQQQQQMQLQQPVNSTMIEAVNDSFHSGSRTPTVTVRSAQARTNDSSLTHVTELSETTQPVNVTNSVVYENHQVQLQRSDHVANSSLSPISAVHSVKSTPSSHHVDSYNTRVEMDSLSRNMSHSKLSDDQQTSNFTEPWSPDTDIQQTQTFYSPSFNADMQTIQVTYDSDIDDITDITTVLQHDANGSAVTSNDFNVPSVTSNDFNVPSVTSNNFNRLAVVSNTTHAKSFPAQEDVYQHIVLPTRQSNTVPRSRPSSLIDEENQLNDRPHTLPINLKDDFVDDDRVKLNEGFASFKEEHIKPKDASANLINEFVVANINAPESLINPASSLGLINIRNNQMTHDSLFKYSSTRLDGPAYSNEKISPNRNESLQPNAKFNEGKILNETVSSGSFGSNTHLSAKPTKERIIYPNRNEYLQPNIKFNEVKRSNETVSSGSYGSDAHMNAKIINKRIINTDRTKSSQPNIKFNEVKRSNETVSSGSFGSDVYLSAKTASSANVAMHGGSMDIQAGIRGVQYASAVDVHQPARITRSEPPSTTRPMSSYDVISSKDKFHDMAERRQREMRRRSANPSRLPQNIHTDFVRVNASHEKEGTSNANSMRLATAQVLQARTDTLSRQQRHATNRNMPMLTKNAETRQ